jgi:hypothetical protein
MNLDAYRLFWLYRRSVGHRAQNIGKLIIAIFIFSKLNILFLTIDIICYIK